MVSHVSGYTLLIIGDWNRSMRNSDTMYLVGPMIRRMLVVIIWECLCSPGTFHLNHPVFTWWRPTVDLNSYTRLCFYINDYHPNTWNPAWSISAILVGLLSFMVRTWLSHKSFELNLIACMLVFIPVGKYPYAG
jgi:hypothetical protein